MLRRAPGGAVLRRLLESDAVGGLLLIAAALAALLVANSGLSDGYHHLLHDPIARALSPKLGPTTPHLLVNDGLMAVFFLLVGLEIKRELVDGRLVTWRQRRLPLLAAAAGMAAPALIYLVATAGRPEFFRGWAIPAATDIAFAIGVLGLLGSRAPTSLKLFITTVAVIDDLGAVIIIALFYTASLNLTALGAALAVLVLMAGLNRGGVRALLPYLLCAALLWYAVLLSGVHPTVAGVLAALAIPAVHTPGAPDAADSPLHRLEHALAPIVAFAIMPVFAFANAGISLAGLSLADALAPLPLGIAAGLFLGKQLGVFGAVWLAVRSGLVGPIRGASWPQIYGVSLLCGIGFTMSLFIGGLAFEGQAPLLDAAKLGILLGSGLSAVAGYTVLRLANGARGAPEDEARLDAEIDADGDIDGFEPEPQPGTSTVSTASGSSPG